METLRRVADRPGLTTREAGSESLPEFVEPELAKWLRRRALIPIRLTLKSRLARPLAQALTRRGNSSGRGESLVAHLEFH